MRLRFRGEDAIPKRPEESSVAAAAEAVRALAAHPGEGGGFDNAASLCQRVEETELGVSREELIKDWVRGCELGHVETANHDWREQAEVFGLAQLAAR